jgi:hypothetical protein
MIRKYLILAQSQVTAQALNSWLPLLGQQPLTVGDKRLIVWQPDNMDANLMTASYEFLASQIEQAARNEDGTLPMDQVVVLVDSMKPDELTAIYEKYSWENLLALLILSFPEIHWCFSLAIDPNFPVGNSLESCTTPYVRNSLFDPIGLRDWVRSRTNVHLRRLGDDLQLPVRTDRAAVVDEEKPYAYLHAYTAYRFGSRTDIVTTWTLMEHLFGDGDANPHGYWLLFEDMSLNFADKPNDVHLLRLDRYREEGIWQGRAEWCPKLDSRSPLENSDYRILITTGQARDDTTLKENESYLQETKQNGNGKALFKPAEGIFGLWGKANLFSKKSWFKGSRDEIHCECLPGDDNLVSPNKKAGSGRKGHGAPGKLMLIAETLIRRSRALLNKADCVEAAVQGAVLATDAFELTGGRTPTTAVDALTLKHHFEVLAECQFYGVGHHIDTEWRWEDIQAETEQISHWFQPAEAKKAKLDAEIHILNRLVRVFREYNRFDEEQQCMIKARRVHNSLWLRKTPWRRLFTPFLRYFELLMHSFFSFFVCLGLCILIFAYLFMLTAPYTSFGHGLFDSVSSILSISTPATHGGSPSDLQFPYSVLACLAIVAGVTHLGVFISHLYTLISRK